MNEQVIRGKNIRRATKMLTLAVAASAAIWTGCKTTGSSEAAGSKVSMSVHEHDGRIFVIGQDASREAFAANHHLPYTLTKIGAGPKGETVICEVDKKDPTLATKLWEQYKAQYLPYAEYAYEGRIYVIGDPETELAFLQNHHLPYTRTKIGAGPKGETLVFEVNKKNPALADRLVAEYTKRHLYYADAMHDNRIYVFGKESTHQEFMTTHHIPYTLTKIGAGPGGKTLVFEVDKKNPHLADRLQREFAARYGTGM